jgi:hypothetical protein
MPTLLPPDHPAKPRLAYRIGIVGHRPNRLVAADLPLLQQSLATVVFLAARQLVDAAAANAPHFTPERPLLRLVTSLAEGADRLFARAVLDDPRIAALPVDLAFSCPLPFFREEYQQDFAPPAALQRDSLNDFQHLLDAMTTRAAVDVFELDGARSAGPAAYAAAGRVVVNQSDLLVLVWDGRHHGESGGTEEMISFAASAGIPIVWIDAHAPHHAALLHPPVAIPLPPPGKRLTPPAANLDAALPRAVAAILDLPVGETREPRGLAHPHAHTSRADRAITFADFRAEQPPRFRFPVLWKAFRTLVGGALPAEPDPVTPAPPVSHAVTAAAARFGPLFDWPDRLAVHYADVYRSAFVLYYFLAAAAVAFVLLPLVSGWEGRRAMLCGAAELLTILTILAIVFRGRSRRWHERWIDYRFAAELLRHVRLALPLGGGHPFPRLPAHLATYGHPAASWMAWYTHAHERAFGLPAARLDKPHLLAALHRLETLLHEQVAYHQQSAHRYHRLEHRLHFAGIILLTATLIACALHLSAEASEHLHWLSPRLLAFLSGFLPALGAAIVGITNQGEFRRIAKRSLSMEQQLSQLLNRVHKLQTAVDTPASAPAPAHAPFPLHRQFSTDAALLASQAARLMVNETLDWRVVLLDRPLELHA